MNSRRKGKTIELDAVRALRALDIEAVRTIQYQGRGSAGDIRIHGAPDLHCEVKGRASLLAARFMDQAVADAYPGCLPIVLMRENRGRFLLMHYLHDLPAVSHALKQAQEAPLPA